jgi:hypothetical protein
VVFEDIIEACDFLKKNDSDIRRWALKTLTERIAQQLKERGFCVVFENDLERCWPSKEMERARRERKIQGFAESQGWTAAILESGFGMRAIFRRLRPDAIGSEGPSVVSR